jgi:DNA repair protein RecO (recombination protein O)
MLHTTRAIVLRTIRHGERAVILKAYTEQLGLRSCIVHVSRRRGLGPAMLQPLNRLELVLDERSGLELATVREARIETPFDVQGDPVRSALLLFVQEVLSRTLREESGDRRLYDFLSSVIEVIGRGKDPAHFPLLFLLHFTEHLGFHPSSPAPGRTPSICAKATSSMGRLPADRAWGRRSVRCSRSCSSLIWTRP